MKADKDNGETTTSWFNHKTKCWVKEWRTNGRLHREDGPAVDWGNGGFTWYKNGFKHRDNGPASIHPNGLKIWYKEGIIHRVDGPAIIWPEGKYEWVIMGESFISKQEWFEALEKEDKLNILLNKGDSFECLL